MIVHAFRLALFSALLASSALPAPAQLSRVPNTSLNLPSTLPSTSGYTTESAVGNLTFSQPVAARSIPGVTSLLFVVEKTGAIQRVDLATNTKVKFFDIADDGDANTSLYLVNESGFLGLAFHPDYVNNGYFYVTYTYRDVAANERYWRLARFQATGAPGQYHLATEVNEAATLQPLITQWDENENHNGGDLAFGPDGYLYVSTGDEGNYNDLRNNSRFINRDFFAAILRLDVDNKPANLPPNANSATRIAHAGTYRVPADNPFIGRTEWNNGTLNPGDPGYRTFLASTVRTEIYATGLRNPWRMSIDMPTGRIFTGDVGQTQFEEINLILPGKDYGWVYREGFQDCTPASSVLPRPPGYYNVPPADTSKNPEDPIHAYGRTLGNAVTGGYVYRGTRLTELTGKYVFGDYASGRVWALTEDSPGSWSSTQLLENVTGISGFGLDPRNGDLLMCRLSAGVIHRLVRSFSGGSPPPPTLSGTGAFSNLATLQPSTGIVAFEPNVSFWSDHAVKHRWFSIPDTTHRMSYSRDGNWSFPTGSATIPGTIWIKHFEMEMVRGSPATARRLETRFLVRGPSGAYGLTYKWRSDGSDADLVGAEGLSETLIIQDGASTIQQTWRYPGRSECMRCHTVAAGYALGFNTRQLNRDVTHGSQEINQLQALEQAGYFNAAPALENVHTLPALARLDDASTSLEWRVRSYLAANCSQCHQPGGGGQGAWDARPHLTTQATGIVNGVASSHQDYKLIWPGDPDHSMILDRIRSNNPPSGAEPMPPVGRHVVDTAAAELMEDWIQLELPGRQTFYEWQETHFGSAAHPDADPTDDPDRDGQSNELEYLARTAPHEPSTAPKIEVHRGNGGLELRYQPIFNRAIIIESSPDLIHWSDWNIPGNHPHFPAAGTPQKVLALPPATGNPQQYYRARLQEL